MIKKITIILFLFLISIFSVKGKEIDIHLFYQDGCPHCENEKIFLNELKDTNKEININYYELGDSINSKLFNDIQTLLDKPTNSVPYTVIGDYALGGFSETTKKDITDIINNYQTTEYRNIVKEYKEDPTITYKRKEIVEDKESIEIPILGEINPKEASIFLVAVVIGFVDGFNPCAMWILIFLISMLIGMKDKKRMKILGFTFILTSAITYMIFMLAWLNVAIFVTEIYLIRLLIGFFALIFGMYNISKYVRKPKDGCEVVDDKKRKNIIEKVKNITSDKRFVVSMIGIMLLAFSVNLLELLCSAGLPFTFTNILAMNNLSNVNYFSYILVYIFFFMLDDLIIFFIAIFTFKVTGVSTKYSRYSSLIGGIIMILIGLAMIVKPEILMFNL